MIARSVQRSSFESVVKERNLCKGNIWFHCSRYRGKECNDVRARESPIPSFRIPSFDRSFLLFSSCFVDPFCTPQDISGFFADFVARPTSSPHKSALLSSHHARAGSPCWHSAAVRKAREGRYHITLGPSNPGPAPAQGSGSGGGDKNQNQNSKMRVTKKKGGDKGGGKVEMEVEVQVAAKVDKNWRSRLVAQANSEWI